MVSATDVSALHTPSHWIPPEPNETPTGDLVADAIRWAIENITGKHVDLGFEVTGLIRQGLVTQTGNITVYDAMSVLPMGWWNFPSGPYWGWTLCSFYLYGWEIKRALEMSVFLKGDYFFQISGIRFWYSDLRSPGDKVIRIEILTEDGNWTTLDTSTSNTTLYLVGCSLQETAVMENLYAKLEAAGAPFFRVHPKFENGTVMTKLPADTILFKGGYPYPESKYFALFLENLTAEHGSIPNIYGATQGRINVWSINPVDFLTLTALGQIIADQQTSSNLVYGGIATLILIVVVAAVVIITRRP